MNIQFRWSYIYEEQIHHPTNFDYNKIESETKEFIERVKTDWDKVERGVVSFLEELTKLKFKSDNLKCYVIHTSKHLPISDPLTIAINLKTEEGTFTLTKERYIDMLIHELIHNLLIENEKETTKYFEELFSGKYSKNWNVSIHVLVHAIHKEIFLKFFDNKRYEKELEASSYFPDYKEAWDIVIKVGSENIIKELRNSVLTKNS